MKFIIRKVKHWIIEIIANDINSGGKVRQAIRSIPYGKKGGNDD